jgi:protein-tyrosine phosphatase
MTEQDQKQIHAEEQQKVTEGEHGHHHSHSSHHHHSHGEHGTHHSHSGHHHHHSSHKRRKRRRNTKAQEKLKNFFKYNKHYLGYAALTIAFVICLLLVGGVMDRRTDEPELPPETETDVEKPEANESLSEIRIKVPLFSEDVVITGEAVDAWISAEAGVTVTDIYQQYGGGNSHLDVSAPLTLYYELSDLPRGEKVKSAEVLVADNEAMQSPLRYQTSGNKSSVDVYNLKTGTQYYFRIQLTFAGGAVATAGGTFKTAEGPRILSVGGVRNIRDIGGWKTVDGRVIKQGLLYRGRELDGAVEAVYLINAEGVNTMLTQLGIKTEMDLRMPSENPYGLHVLGPSVEHIYYSAPMYVNIFNGTENPEKIRVIFSDLADESKYPVYLHCTYGQDRTGTVCYLLGALLGMDAESLSKEYQLSGLCYGGVETDLFDAFVLKVGSLPGNTLSQKVENYLLSIGVTAEEIASIRHIFLDEQ